MTKQILLGAFLPAAVALVVAAGLVIGLNFHPQPFVSTYGPWVEPQASSVGVSVGVHSGRHGMYWSAVWESRGPIFYGETY